MQKLTATILRADLDNNHHVNDLELKLLTLRIELIDGLPFSSQDLRERFRKQKDECNKSLRHLADTIRTLYLEKREQQHHKQLRGKLDINSHMMSVPVLLRRKVQAAYAA